MTGSVALDVVIGLVFIYSLYSLLATTFTEFISTWLKLRSVFLAKGIKRMLDNENASVFSNDFFNQPLIRYLKSSDLFGRFLKTPAYLSAQNFSKATIEVLREKGKQIKPNEALIKQIKEALKGEAGEQNDTLQFIDSLLRDAQDDVDKFKALMERWYDDTMERVSGWYKKWIQVITFFVGLGIAIVFNVDTLLIVEKLSVDEKAREQYVAMAKEFVNDKMILAKVDSIKKGSKDSLVFDKVMEDYQKLSSLAFKSQNVLAVPRYKDGCGNIQWGKHIWGWLITAVALSLGSPFWFDLLNKLMKLRTSVQTSKSEDRTSAGTSNKPGSSQIEG